jgi:hypothetical protein
MRRLPGAEHAGHSTGKGNPRRKRERRPHAEDRRTGLAVSARRWAKANLGWNGVVAAYERLYAELLRERSSSRT